MKDVNALLSEDLDAVFGTDAQNTRDERNQAWKVGIGG
jgi:hypothetical protein